MGRTGARWPRVLLILFLAVFAVYWRALRGQFIWDDVLVVQRNPLVTGELGLGAIWFHTDFPLRRGLLAGVAGVGESTRLGYHVVSVLLHATSAVLLWRVLARLKVPAAWLAAMIFAVHPLCVASVAWIAELKNTLSLPFYLLSILWYLRRESDLRPSDFGLRTSTTYALSLLAFLLALLSKTSTVMLPVVLLGCAWWQRGRLSWRDWCTHQPLLRAGAGVRADEHLVSGARGDGRRRRSDTRTSGDGWPARAWRSGFTWAKRAAAAPEHDLSAMED